MRIKLRILRSEYYRRIERVPVTIGINIASLMAQRKLREASNSLGTTFERLSSGMRINRASDDAAGLAISSSLQTNARVLSQAMRNINDGVSALNIAESSIREMSSLVLRIKELAEQSANGIYSDSQRNALDTEAQHLKAEFNRILTTTSYNGIQLLDGSAGQMTLQVGMDSRVHSTINIGLGSIASTIIGTGEFSDGVQFSGVAVSSSTIVGDFTGDGHLDVVTTARPQIFVGNGDGTFKAGVTISAVSHSNALSVGDIDGNGIDDFVAYITGTGVRAFLSQGDGSFTQSTVGGTVVSAANLQLADLNADNKLDLVVSSGANGADFYVMMGNGNGTFKAATTYVTATNLWSSTLADINNDGRLDLITGHTGSALYFWLGQGDGTFAASTSITTTVGTPGFMRTGDANNDGNIDLVISNLGSDPIVRLGNGNGTFKAGTVPFTGDTARFLDVDGDGYDDLIQSSSTSITIWKSNGDGTFSLHDTSTIASDGGIFLNTGDANGDGVDDIIVGTDSLSGVSVLLAEVNSVGGLGEVDLTSVSRSITTLTNMDTTYDALSRTLGTIGSLQSRLSVALSNAGATRDAYIAAASRITDVDVAQETANLIRNQLLKDVAAFILSHSVKSADLVIALLT